MSSCETSGPAVASCARRSVTSVPAVRPRPASGARRATRPRAACQTRASGGAPCADADATLRAARAGVLPSDPGPRGHRPAAVERCHWRRVDEGLAEILAGVHDGFVSSPTFLRRRRNDEPNLTRSMSRHPRRCWSRGRVVPASEAVDPSAAADESLPCYLALPPVEDEATRQAAVPPRRTRARRHGLEGGHRRLSRRRVAALRQRLPARRLHGSPAIGCAERHPRDRHRHGSVHRRPGTARRGICMRSRWFRARPNSPCCGRARKARSTSASPSAATTAGCPTATPPSTGSS